jgi:hypothetical protein
MNQSHKNVSDDVAVLHQELDSSSCGSNEAKRAQQQDV